MNPYYRKIITAGWPQFNWYMPPMQQPQRTSKLVALVEQDVVVAVDGTLWKLTIIDKKAHYQYYGCVMTPVERTNAKKSRFNRWTQNLSQ